MPLNKSEDVRLGNKASCICILFLANLCIANIHGCHSHTLANKSVLCGSATFRIRNLRKVLHMLEFIFFTFTPGKKYSLSFHLVEKDTVQIRIRQNYADPTGSGSTTLP